jgi:hypothetical protein
MKTRLAILELDHDSALTQKIENEINVRELTRRSLILKPGEEYTKVVQGIESKKNLIKALDEVLQIIEEMMKEEEK